VSPGESRAAEAGGLALLALGPSVFVASLGSDHTSAGTSPAPAPRQEGLGIAAHGLSSGLPSARRGPGRRGHSAPARTAGDSNPHGVYGVRVPRSHG
jgi:hypothetical protein